MAPPVRLSYAVAVAFFACLAIALTGVLYTNHVQQVADRRSTAERADSDHRWCALLTDLDNAYSAPPGPTTEVGVKVAAEIRKLRESFRCPG